MQTDTTNSGAADAGEDQSRLGIAEQAKRAARREMDDANERLAAAAGKARGAATKAGRSIQHLVIEELDRRKNGFFEGLEAVTGTIRKAADELNQNEDAPGAPRLVHRAVNTVEDMTDRFKYQSVEEIGQTLSRYGRENPALFIAGALLAGLAVGRFFIASSADAGRVIEDWDDDLDRSPRQRATPQGSPERRSQSASGQPGSASLARDAYGTGQQNELPTGTGKSEGDETSGGALTYGQSGSAQVGGVGQQATAQASGAVAEGVTKESGGGGLVFVSGTAKPSPKTSSQEGHGDGTS